MYSEQELEQQPLIDDDQWGRLESELGLEMLQEFALEFFEETREIWFVPGFDPFSMEEKAFKSMAHRSAGACGHHRLQETEVRFFVHGAQSAW